MNTKLHDSLNSYEIVTFILLLLKEKAKIGMRLLELNALAEEIIEKNEAKAINKGYMGLDSWDKSIAPKEPFPTALVCNVNSVMAHGHATEYILKAGDIVCFDLGVEKDGICADSAIMVLMPGVKGKNKQLVRAAKHTLMEGLAIIKHGTTLADVGAKMEHIANSKGFIIVQTFCSHGIGKKMHELPNIPNFWTNEKELEYFEEGKQYCIEPILTFKDRYGMRVSDWGFVTRDGSYAAMFEKQILVTKDGYISLTTHI